MKLLLSPEIFRVDVCDVIPLQIEDAKRADSPERMHSNCWYARVSNSQYLQLLEIRKDVIANGDDMTRILDLDDLHLQVDVARRPLSQLCVVASRHVAAAFVEIADAFVRALAEN